MQNILNDSRDNISERRGLTLSQENPLNHSTNSCGNTNYIYNNIPKYYQYHPYKQSQELKPLFTSNINGNNNDTYPTNDTFQTINHYDGDHQIGTLSHHREHMEHMEHLEYSTINNNNYNHQQTSYTGVHHSPYDSYSDNINNNIQNNYRSPHTNEYYC